MSIGYFCGVADEGAVLPVVVDVVDFLLFLLCFFAFELSVVEDVVDWS